MNLYEFYQAAKAENIILYYCGPIAHASVEGVAQTLRKNLEYEEAGNQVAQSVFSIFIEQVQNVLNYSAEKPPSFKMAEDDLKVGMVVIGHENAGYYILCGNKVFNSDIGILQEKIDFLCHMNKEELKALYKERRRMDPGPGSKGAGLGLIEMARKSSEPLEYDFIPIDDEFSFFTIRAAVRS
jgi:hypothetical protein